ncbi:thioester domain-containing protein [Streptomyces sp. NPDC052077]|uniref:thioester domain-containing protein n=1 Tax=Streptomyces sp. NPDC052077 TaxID=3154757 RepID=UPI00343863CA
MTTGVLACVTLLVPGVAASAAVAASPQDGGTVHIGARQGYSGTGIFPVSTGEPAGGGEPDAWAYCIEHDVSALTNVRGTVGGHGSYLGANRFTDPAVRSKVLWVLTHSYPALGLEEFGAAAGVPGIARADAIEATQYAIWRYTELDFDADWAWETADSEAAYRHLIAGANADTGPTPEDTATELSLSAPSAPQQAGTLVGPFVVSANRPSVAVSVDPAVALTDADGAALDPDALTDGQALYLDLRDTKSSGSATVTATAAGSSLTGRIVSVPTTAGATPTAEDHAQTIILVAPKTATTNAEAVVEWQGDEDDGTTGGGTTPSTGPSTSASPTPGDGDDGTTGGGTNPSTGPSTSASPTPGGGDGGTSGGGTAPATASDTPAPAVPDGPMAETGSSGTGVITGIAAALLVAGGGVLFAVRRRRAARG